MSREPTQIVLIGSRDREVIPPTATFEEQPMLSPFRREKRRRFDDCCCPRPECRTKNAPFHTWQLCRTAWLVASSKTCMCDPSQNSRKVPRNRPGSNGHRSAPASQVGSVIVGVCGNRYPDAVCTSCCRTIAGRHIHPHLMSPQGGAVRVVCSPLSCKEINFVC
jgi:hypothetical protein